MSAVFIEGGPLLPSLEHLVEYYSTYADGLPDTLSVAISPCEFIYHLILICLFSRLSAGGLVPMRKQSPVKNAESRSLQPENVI